MYNKYETNWTVITPHFKEISQEKFLNFSQIYTDTYKFPHETGFVIIHE